MGYRYYYDYPHLTYRGTLTDEADPSEFERHCHAMYELLYVMRGSGKYVVESTEYPLCPGTVLLLRPYEFHYVCPDPGCAYERVVLNFDEEAATAFASSLAIMKKETFAGNGVYFSSENLHEAVRSAFMAMREVPTVIGTAATHAACERELMHSLLTQILIWLSVSKPDRLPEAYDNTVSRVLTYLNLHLTEDLSLDDLAQYVFVSKYHLCRAFRKHTGVSVMTYFNNKRIALAQRLLNEGEPATAVAGSVGFQNYSSFYRAYCKYAGQPPARRRRGEEGAEETGALLPVKQKEAEA